MQVAAARPDPYATNEDWAAAGIALPPADSDYWVAHVASVGPLSLHVRFRDGVEGSVRFEKSALRGVFEALNDPAIFAQADAKDGVVTWPNEIDISPDNMHRHLFAFGEWVLQ
jgi:Protein of unknown function (DUF2442)